MPTPVSVARQCLTDEAARALDDAVSVARRRCHGQTTSLHAVSALLTLPSSVLREACSRARSCAYSPRLHFRALELSVGVSLDRLPSSKSLEEPPVSNSLMAAIKRSQANQRRHPESFHLHQIHNQQQAASLLKVELKHFILSILDDPIVSKVFGEAGFRSCDIKMAIMHQPMNQTSRFSRTRCPPIFLCNVTDSDTARRNFSFPFIGCFGNGDGDEYCRRIGEVLVKKSGKNPLLIGVYAADALRSFTECVQRGKMDLLPAELSGLRIISIGNDISEFISGIRSEEKMGLKFKEVNRMVEHCSGPGVAVNFGELNSLVSESVEEDAVSYVVSQLTGLLKLQGGKLWLIGAAGSYETHAKLLSPFPSIEKEWDLHLLPITSSKSSIDGFGSKSSLMGSFVPFGGFFSTPSQFRLPLSSHSQSFTRCSQCTERYEQEIAAIWKGGSTISLSDQYSETLPLWLQMNNFDKKSKESNASKTKDDETTLSAKVLGLQRKWNEVCQRLHHGQQSSKLDISQTRSEIPSTEAIRFASHKENDSENSTVIGGKSASLNPSIPVDSQNNFLSKQNVQITATSTSTIVEKESHLFPSDQKSSSFPSVTTDLGLGTLYASTSQKHRAPELTYHQERMQQLSCSISVGSDGLKAKTSCQIARSDPSLGLQFDPRDSKSLRKALKEKVGWQDEAILSISEAISHCRSGIGRHHHRSNFRGDIWLTFSGPDKIGKKKIALALAEVMFGTAGSLIAVDLSSQDTVCQSNSLFECKDLEGCDVMFRGEMIVDYIAGQMRKKSHSVVFLENVDKADLLARNSLSQAIKTGKFSNSHGREISISNMIFVTALKTSKAGEIFHSGKKPVEFPEEIILSAKNYQMKILLHSTEDACQTHDMNVTITTMKVGSNPVHKRKLSETSDSTEQEQTFEKQKRTQKVSMSFLDLNLPVEEIEEEINDGDCDSDSSEGSEAWLEEYLKQVDENVDFQPFDFSANAEKLKREISIQFEKVFGSEIKLEIDYAVMVQILAADWLSNKKRAVEDWVEQVLNRSFVEARQKYQPTAHSIIKLVACDGVIVEEQAPGTCLPARVNLN